MPEPTENKDTTNAVNPAYTWQNPQATSVLPGNSRFKKILMITAGVIVFFGLAVLLAFI